MTSVIRLTLVHLWYIWDTSVMISVIRLFDLRVYLSCHEHLFDSSLRSTSLSVFSRASLFDRLFCFSLVLVCEQER